MSGQPTPPVLIEAFALNAPDCTPAAPVAGGKTAPFPAASQIAVTPGAASLADGFVPLNMTPQSSGGIPPFGVDANGILFVLSAHIAALNAGQGYKWNSTLEAAMGGYAIGAVLQSATNPNLFFVNTVAGNVNNPDVTLTGWIASVPQYATSAPTAGVHADNVLPGPSDYVLDFDTTAGAVTLNGFVAQRDGQRLVISNIGANALTVGNLAGSAGNQVRASGSGTAILQNDSVTLQYVHAITAWVIT